MIRTRDFLIFVGVLLFLGMAIAVTLIAEQGSGVLKGQSFFFDVPVEDETYTVQTTQTVADRDSIITRLRDALAVYTSDIEPSPSVEEVEVKEPDVVEGETGGVMKCGGADDAALFAQSWPLSGVSVTPSGALRTVVHAGSPDVQAIDVNASTTAVVPQNTVLIAFPLSPSASSLPNCVPSDVVGVTVTGSLMWNADASFYLGYGPEYLIGYARDGYPIYGYYQGATDACGGYMHASGYRYSVSPDRGYVLGCYTAAPASFSQ